MRCWCRKFDHDEIGREAYTKRDYSRYKHLILILFIIMIINLDMSDPSLRYIPTTFENNIFILGKNANSSTLQYPLLIFLFIFFFFSFTMWIYNVNYTFSVEDLIIAYQDDLKTDTPIDNFGTTCLSLYVLLGTLLFPVIIFVSYFHLLKDECNQSGGICSQCAQPYPLCTNKPTVSPNSNITLSCLCSYGICSPDTVCRPRASLCDIPEVIILLLWYQYCDIEGLKGLWSEWNRRMSSRWKRRTWWMWCMWWRQFQLHRSR